MDNQLIQSLMPQLKLITKEINIIAEALNNPWTVWIPLGATVGTFILAIATICIARATILALKENQKYRQFELIRKKLDEFYGPLIGYLFETEHRLNSIKSIEKETDFITSSLLYLKPILNVNPAIKIEESIKQNIVALLPAYASISENKILLESTNFDKIKEIVLIKRHFMETETKKEIASFNENKNNLNFLLIKYFINKFNELYNNELDFEKEPYKMYKEPYNLINQAKWDDWENFYKILQSDYDKLDKQLDQLQLPKETLV